MTIVLKTSSAASMQRMCVTRHTMETGVDIIRRRWAQRQRRAGADNPGARDAWREMGW